MELIARNSSDVEIRDKKLLQHFGWNTKFYRFVNVRNITRCAVTHFAGI